jgi:hypothetical protein
MNSIASWWMPEIKVKLGYIWRSWGVDYLTGGSSRFFLSVCKFLSDYATSAADSNFVGSVRLTVVGVFFNRFREIFSQLSYAQENVAVVVVFRDLTLFHYTFWYECLLGVACSTVAYHCSTCICLSVCQISTPLPCQVLIHSDQPLFYLTNIAHHLLLLRRACGRSSSGLLFIRWAILQEVTNDTGRIKGIRAKGPKVGLELITYSYSTILIR